MTDTVHRSGFVEVRNVGRTPLRLALNSRVWEVAPGAKAIVDREAACNLLGNWELRDHPTDPLRKPRSKEFQRIRGLFGAMSGGTYQEIDADGKIGKLDIDKAWETRRPHAEVTEDGKRVVLVIDDPTGTSLPSEDPTGKDRDGLIQHLLVQQQQMADMIARLEAEQRSPSEAVDILEDGPSVKPVARRKQHEVIPVDDRDG